MRALRTVLVGLLLIPLIYLGMLTFAFATIPRHKGSETHFDTLIVLGTPARADGTPSPELRERIDEGVREYRAGVASHLIMTGGAAHNRFVEAQVMAGYAAQEGVPDEAILMETQAKDTIQNIWFSRKIMLEHDWRSAEVISSPYHLPRTALILEQYRGPFALDWRTQAAKWPAEYGWSMKLKKDFAEAVGCLRLRWHGFKPSRFLPAS